MEFLGELADNPDNLKTMRKTHRKSRPSQASGGYDQSSAPSEFYTASPVEKPLYEDRQATGSRSVRRTDRHQQVMSRRKETMDPREKMALMAILKLAITVLLLMIAFVLLWKGIGFYEASRVQAEIDAESEPSSIMKAVELVEDFDIEDQDSREKFAERIGNWKEADRMVRSADALLQRNLYDPAIAQCKDALERDPSHRGALERLGRLYYAKEDYAAAVNIYIRLMSVDPSHQEIQKRLIQALDALGDYKAVNYMAEWYFDQNMYDGDVQRYLANALYAQEQFEEAVEAYGRVLRNAPEDPVAMERQAAARMQLGQYEEALEALETLRRKNYRNPVYYKQIVICNAQMQRGRETVQSLGRAAQVFGEQIVIGWLQDPQLDPVREDRAFQAFTDRVGGEEFRLWLEKMAQGIKVGGQSKPEANPFQLEMPDIEKRMDSELLKPKRAGQASP